MKQIATWIRECDEAHFERVFAPFPEVSLWNARRISVPSEKMDALLLTGGSDISLGYLRQPVSNEKLIEDPDPARDAWEFEVLTKALAQSLPILGICRGLQVLNVALDGTLHLDIPNHDRPESKYGNIQKLHYAEGAPVRFSRVNSSHHQALDRLGRGLEVKARCADDDVIEEAQLVDYPFALGVQYHPERDPLYSSLFQLFVERIGEKSK